MMKIGIESAAYIGRYGLTEGIRRMKAHGYECVDYQGFVDTETSLFRGSDADFEHTLIEERAAFEEGGIEISQVHGPWRWPPKDFEEADRQERFEKMAKSIRGTKILGCRNFVIHPIMPFGDNRDPYPDKLWEMNYEFFGRLLEVAIKNDVVICYENMPMTALSNSRPAQILEFAKKMDSENFKVCLDTGHCSVFGESPADAVRLLGKKYLQVLHVHDNNGVSDFHWLPYYGVIDWNDFTKALLEIGFEGTLSLETAVSGKIPPDIRESHEIALFETAKKLAGR